MTKITLYETLETDIDFSMPSVFLAGPTVRGNQPHLKSWRVEAINVFKSKGFNGNLIIPEFGSATESDQFRYDVPVWEFFGLRNCSCIMFWVPRTKELIGLTTNHEHGYWMGREREKMVYGRPNDAYRVSYLDIMWVQDLRNRSHLNSGCPIYTTIEKTVEAAITLAHERFGRNEF